MPLAGNAPGGGTVYGTFGTATTPAGSATGTATGTQPSATNPVVPPAGTVPTYSTKFKATQGWYMALGVVTAIMLGNTPIAPFALGVLGVALLYQTGQWLQHK
jgi:hypothetical protein